MAKKQQRIPQVLLQQKRQQWLSKAASVVLLSGAVYEVHTLALQEGQLLGTDHVGISHSFPLDQIKELILDFPVAEHAQTSAD